MYFRRFSAVGLVCVVGILIALRPAALRGAGPEPFSHLTIVAPAARDGGWDQIARAVAETLRAEGLARDVDVINSPGAGGAIGLAQFISGARGNGEALIVGGHVMLGAIRANQAALSLLDSTPIARLTSEYVTLVVPNDSSIRGVDDLVTILRADPGAVTWAGGSAGGTEHALVLSIADALGIARERVNYSAFPGGRGPLDALVHHRAQVAVGGYGEFLAALSNHEVRGLAIAAPSALPGITLPLVAINGIDLVSENWRGVFAPPEITDVEKKRLLELMTLMVRTPTWRRLLSEHHWIDRFLNGDRFVSFLREEQMRAAGSETTSRPVTARLAKATGDNARVRYVLITAAIALAAAVAFMLVVRQRKADIPQPGAAQGESVPQVLTPETLENLEQEIDRQFAAWALTSAEREVALLLLKGLRHKEIATVRATSERTVRQQAASVYRKAGVDGRNELAAFFFEDRLVPLKPEGVRT